MKIKYIYTVESGEYSDHGIDAVFLDKKKAEHYAEAQNQIEENYYESYVVEREVWDDKIDITSTVRTYYMCEIDKNSGTIYTDDWEMDSVKEKLLDKRDSFLEGHEDDDSLITAYSVKSYDHAKKIALDFYYEYKAKKEGLI